MNFKRIRRDGAAGAVVAQAAPRARLTCTITFGPQTVLAAVRRITGLQLATAHAVDCLRNARPSNSIPSSISGSILARSSLAHRHWVEVNLSE